MWLLKVSCSRCGVQCDLILSDCLSLLQVPLNEYDFPQNKLASVQAQLERLVEKNYYLHQSARDAYRYAALLTPQAPACMAWGSMQLGCLYLVDLVERTLSA